MDRRSAVKSMLIFAGGLMLVPSCMVEEGKASIDLKHLDVSAEQEKLLAEMVETIIPATDTVGAKELGVHLFVLKMVDDTYSAPDQKAFVHGLEAFQQMTKKQMGHSFLECSPAQRQEIIAAVNAGKAPADVLLFFTILKNQTINGFLNSKLVMTKLRIYELVPGRYNAYFPVKKSQIS